MSDLNRPLVTIALPTFNRHEGLKQSLECFIRQTYKNIEIVISDNHSDYNPTSLVDSYIKDDPRIKFYRQKTNIGMKANGDFLFSKANGKYFLLGSDDDWWDPEFIETMVELLEHNPGASCAISDFQEILPNGRRALYRSRYKFLPGKKNKYPDHLLLLTEFSIDNKVQRLRNFINQSEADGKANVHRALCRTDDYLAAIKELYDLDLTECWAFDQLLAFMMLIKGRLVVCPKLMFKCTISNPKHYKYETSRIEYLLGYDYIIKAHLSHHEAIILREDINNKFLDKGLGFWQELEAKIIFTYSIILSSNDPRRIQILLIDIRNKLKNSEFIELAILIKKLLLFKDFRYITKNSKYDIKSIIKIRLNEFKVFRQINKIIKSKC